MTDHDPSFDQLDERARQLSADAEHLYGVTKRRKEALRAANEQALQVTGEATARDGSVRATVDAGGMLTDLALSAETLRSDPTDLARLVTAVTQQAAARARAAVRDVYESLRDERVVRGIPVLLPEPVVQEERANLPRRVEFDEEASYEERTITRRSGRR
ncbi:YbaB/EbfC family nucleoid-associated protein [Actinophytocola sp.]|uniref:YbaB/EbfC family nucleoid-associated protein n=1 Tax=Actinophytocola sp. TaxID=1872138 RepID=UPI002ED38CCC